MSTMMTPSGSPLTGSNMARATDTMSSALELKMLRMLRPMACR